MNEWMRGDQSVPIDLNLEGKLVRGIEGLSAVWTFTDPVTDEGMPVPVAIISFSTRDQQVATFVFTLGGLSSLMSYMSEHFVNVLGGVEPVSGGLTDEGLQRLIDDVMDSDINNEGDGNE